MDYYYTMKAHDRSWHMRKSDGKQVECCGCGKVHVRLNGEGNAIAPVCRECNEEIKNRIDRLVRSWGKEGEIC